MWFVFLSAHLMFYYPSPGLCRVEHRPCRRQAHPTDQSKGWRFVTLDCDISSSYWPFSGRFLIFLATLLFLCACGNRSECLLRSANVLLGDSQTLACGFWISEMKRFASRILWKIGWVYKSWIWVQLTWNYRFTFFSDLFWIDFFTGLWSLSPPFFVI